MIDPHAPDRPCLAGPVVRVRCYLALDDQDLTTIEPVLEFTLVDPRTADADTAAALRVLAGHLDAGEAT